MPLARGLLAACGLMLGLYGGAARSADPPLGHYPVDPAQVSVSGISSGAFMANQLHIAHSAGIMGAAMIAGGLYGCSVIDSNPGPDGVTALVSQAVGPCMAVPTLLRPAGFYATLVQNLAQLGMIDDPSNLAASHVYIFTGAADTVVSPKTVELARAVYGALGVPDVNIRFDDQNLPAPGAGHSWVTQTFGIACNSNAKNFINKCGYDQAGIELQQIYGPLAQPDVTPDGHFVTFDQTEFVPGGDAAAYGMSNTGYLYVPTTCEPGATPRCRLQVALHGCLQSAEVVGSEFYTKIGINQWADTNRIMVLYPQAHATTASELASQNFMSLLNTNLQGCWNWWGYANDKQFLTKNGVQVNAIWQMVQRIDGQL